MAAAAQEIQARQQQQAALQATPGYSRALQGGSATGKGGGGGGVLGALTSEGGGVAPFIFVAALSRLRRATSGQGVNITVYPQTHRPGSRKSRPHTRQTPDQLRSWPPLPERRIRGSSTFHDSSRTHNRH